jgi:metal-responsive CopG/Arc/MetJ family transcriptional regulator
MTVNVTLTFPEKVLKKVDEKRQEVNRSRYVIKLLEKAMIEDCPEGKEANKK